MIKVNGLLLESFSITCSVCQGCLFSPLLYMLALKYLLKKLDILKSIPQDLGYGRFVTVCADIAVIV